MTRRKRLTEYLFLALFMLCMALAISATLDYMTRATNREYLNQGLSMLGVVAGALALFFAVRLGHRLSLRLSSRVQTVILLSVCAVFLVIGLLLRLWVIDHIVLEPASDFETYYRLADHLLHDTLLTPEGEVYRRYVALYPHTIGYPMLVLQPVFRLFGQSVRNALLANLCCSMLSIVCAGHIARRLTGRMGCAFTVALMSLWPSHILYGSMVATEPAFTLLLLVCFEVMLTILDRDEHSLYDRAPGSILLLLALLGILLAIAGAIRPMAVILLAAYAVLQLGTHGDPTGRLRLEGARYAISAGAFCLVVVLSFYVGTGAIIRRAISDVIAERPASGLTASGYNLMVGMNAESKGLWNDEDASFFSEAYESTGSADAAHRACFEAAIRRFRDEPENVLDLFVYKFRDLWQTDDFGIDWNLLWAGQQGTLTDELTALLERIRPIGRELYLTLLILDLIAALAAWRRTRAPSPGLLICILFFLGTALSHMLLETQVRYHYNTIPFLILIAAFTIAEWRERRADEPPIRLVEVEREPESKDMTDHTHFDMQEAIRDGHVRVSVTKRYEQPIETDEEHTAPRE